MTKALKKALSCDPYRILLGSLILHLNRLYNYEFRIFKVHLLTVEATESRALTIGPFATSFISFIAMCGAIAVI